MTVVNGSVERDAPCTPRDLTIESLANALRCVFNRLARRFESVTVVAILGAAAIAVAMVQLWFLTRGCGRLAISLIKLEVTFSATRFARILDEAGACRGNVIDSLITVDLVFPVFYSAAIAALFIWIERWRWITPDVGRPNRPTPNVGRGRNLAVLAPFAAGALDILGENLPLWGAAKLVTDNPAAVRDVWVRALVFVGSAAATLKCVLLLLSACAILIELVSGPRGIVLRRLRYSVLSVALGALPLLLVPQGKDILQRLVEGERPLLRVLLTAIPPVVFAALAVWYCGRKLVQFRFSTVLDDPDQRWYAHFAEHLPRVLGISLIVISGAAFASAGLALIRFVVVAAFGYLLTLLLSRRSRRQKAPPADVEREVAGQASEKPTWLARLGRLVMIGRWKTIPSFDDRIGRAIVATVVGVLIWLPHTLRRGACRVVPCAADEAEWAIWYLRLAAWLCLAAAWVFYLHVYYRRARMRARGKGKPDKPLDSIDLDSVRRGLKIGALTAAVASVVVLLVFTVAPVPVGRGLGPLWILAVTAANAVFIGSLTAWVYERYGIRLVTLSIIVAVMFSLWNDNHVVRKLEGSRERVSRRSSIAAHLDAWLDTTTMRSADGTIPVFLVASSGGGLRAAYWAATSLAAVQDSSPMFARHVFAASGVSGGSLGLALFTGFVRDANGMADSLPCGRDSRAEARARQAFGPYSACVRYFLRDDFLSPVLAKLVAPDVAQWFLPIPITAFDRATALEESWETSYATATGQQTFAAGFLDLANPRDSAQKLPSLFLNGTHVETGERYIAAHLVRDSATSVGAGSRSMLASRDLLDVMGSDLRVSTAVHNSARFTYVSPAGRVDGPGGIEYGHVVDGGYFENSGLETLGELHEAVRSRPDGGPALRPVVVYLCNDPIPCARELGGDTLLKTAGDIAGEWLAPARAILRARGARGSLARAELRSMSGLEFLQLNVCDDLRSSAPAPSSTDTVAVDSAMLVLARNRVVTPPLGWLLSRLARDWMDSSLTGRLPRDRGTCREHNAFVLQRIRTLMQGMPGSRPPATVISR